MPTKSPQHPTGLGWLSITYGLYMWSFTTIIASLTLDLKHLPHISTHTAYVIYATFASLLWTLPIFGGYTAERVGFLRASTIGIIFCLTGTLLLCCNTLIYSEIGLSFFLIGNALFTPSVWCLVDHIYPKQDGKRESGFTLFYLVFNILSVAGIFISTNIGSRYGYTLEYSLCSVFCVLSLLSLLYTSQKMQVHPSRNIAPQVKMNKPSLNGITTLIALLITPVIFILLFYPFLNTLLTLIMVVVMTGILLHIANKQPKPHAKNKILGFIILCFFATGFWTLYNIEPSLLSVYIKDYVSLSLFHITLSPDSLFGFECFFIVIIGLFTSRLWFILSQRNQDPNLAIKFGLALILIALGFIYLYIVTSVHGTNTKLPVKLIIISYAFFATGELFIGPLGISMVGKLSPEGREGLFMGAWQLTVGFGAILTSAISSLSIPAAGNSFAQSNQHYIHLFLEMGFIIMLAGILILAVSPWVKKLLD